MGTSPSHTPTAPKPSENDVLTSFDGDWDGDGDVDNSNQLYAKTEHLVLKHSGPSAALGRRG